MDSMIMIIKRLLLTTGLSISICLAQGGDSIYQTLMTGAIIPTTSANVRNIGQNTHKIITHTAGCGAGSITAVAIFGSATNVAGTFQLIGGANVVTVDGMALAGGLFPYVHVLVTPGAGCTVDAYYVGTKNVEVPSPQGYDISGLTHFMRFDYGYASGFSAALQVRQSASAYAVSYQAANAAGVVLHAAGAGCSELKRIIVGVAGTGSTFTLLKGAATLMILDTTVVGNYEIGIPLCSTVDAFTYTTAGAAAAKLSVLTLVPGIE